MTEFMHKNYDPIVYTFDKLVDMPEGKAALEKLHEREQEEALAEYREAEQESKAKAEEQIERENKPKKMDRKR